MLATDVPVTIDRDAAREAARRELDNPAYHLDDETLWDRIWNWVFERLGNLLDAAAAATPGGAPALIALLLLIAFVVVAVRLRVGPLAGSARGEAPLFGRKALRAGEYRSAAEAALAAGDLAEAIRQLFRAVVRDLEERGLLDPRPGRTADEAAAEAGRLFPASAAELAQAARGFDEVWYGDRPATEAAYHRLVAVDGHLRSAWPVGARP